ncbi:sigma-70 family RNA polymerase sigma factor [Hyphomonas sp. WL0036]|uniref:sigma-70 family RNA polymerase sigma factor n=1 Tax=Hyphomonas sediminis TaxID=2866160 RepID=UPI001C80A463|nr:sigma-70 family RNA polymerase sigma factor [Hyphomonas sediminis]MBY9066418.1 sigma-70 family RNA polymerase sigma factor [Hyphomonas sediminis]
MNEAEFVAQLEAMVPHLRAFARQLCKGDDLADDLVQETCLKAWSARERFVDGAPMKPWLFRILRNAHAQHWRRAWRSTQLDPAGAENALVVPANQEWACDFQTMQKAMQHLPDTQIDAVLTVLVAGFSYEEAGHILGCSEGTVKSRVSRGREALASIMNAPARPQMDPTSEPQAAAPESPKAA